MISTDDLVRELHAQAEETRAWPAPRLRRTPPRRTSRIRTGLLVLGTALAVAVAVVAVPRALQRPEQQYGAPAIVKRSPPEERASAQAWSVERCLPNGSRCTVPYLLREDGTRYASVAGGQAPTYAGGRVTSRFLTYQRDKSSREAYVLVGAVGSRTGSRLVVTFGDRAPIELSPGRLSFLPLPDRSAGLEVRVRELTRPVPHETLVIEEYEPLR